MFNKLGILQGQKAGDSSLLQQAGRDNNISINFYLEKDPINIEQTEISPHITENKITKKVSQENLDGLAELRSWAVSNLFAVTVANRKEYENIWAPKLDEWIAITGKYLEDNFPMADFYIFRDIGPLTLINFQHGNPNIKGNKHNFWLSILAVKLERILQTISDYRGKVS